MVRLGEMPPSLFSNPLENNSLSSSSLSLGQCNSDQSPYLPSLHTVPSQMRPFPSPLNRDLLSSCVLKKEPEGWSGSSDGGREEHTKEAVNKMAAWNSFAKNDQKHGNKLQQFVLSSPHSGREVIEMNRPSPKEERLLRKANRRREGNCLTAAWWHQQPFSKGVAREVRRLYGIPREVAVLGWLLAGGELWCRAMLRLLFKLPLPNVVHDLFRVLDEATCCGLQWVETTRRAAGRSERCPAWRRAVRALVAAGVAPFAVLWGRWHSRQQRLFLQEAGVLCPPHEDSQWGVLGTTADILLEIMAEISAALLGRAGAELNHPLTVAQEPALDTVAEEDEEGCHEEDDPDSEEDTIPLWELCWPDDEVVIGRKRNDLQNDEIKLNISNDTDTLHDSNSNKILTPDRAVTNEHSGGTYTEDAKRLSTQHRRNYSNEMDKAQASLCGLFPTWPPNAPPAVTPHTASLTLPWSPGVQGSTFPCRGQDPAWEILFHLYCSLFRIMFIIPMLLMTVVRSDRHREEDDQRSWTSVLPDHARTSDEEGHSTLTELDEHCEGQWNGAQLQHSWEKHYKSDQRRRSQFSSSSCDDVWEKEPTGSSDGSANRPNKSRVVTGGKKSKSSNSNKLSQETCDFIEPGLSDYEEEMWLQLGITPQESKKEDEEMDIKKTHEDYFESWLKEERREKSEDVSDAHYFDETDILRSLDNVEHEHGVRSAATQNSVCKAEMPSLTRTQKRASESEKSSLTRTQNSACESEKPSLTRSFTYILRTKSENLDCYSIPGASVNKSSEYDMKAVKDQTNSKTRTELLNADHGSETTSSDFKYTANLINRSTQSKTAPPKAIQRGAKIGRPVTRKLQTKSSSSSEMNFQQKLHKNQLRRTDHSFHKSYPVKPIGKLNHLKLKNASETSARNISYSSGNISYSSGMLPSEISAPSFKVDALGNQTHRPAQTRMNGSIVDEQQKSILNSRKIMKKTNSSDSKIQSRIEQKKDHKPWRSCCMNSQNIHKDASCASSRKKNAEEAQ